MMWCAGKCRQGIYQSGKRDFDAKDMIPKHMSMDST